MAYFDHVLKNFDLTFFLLMLAYGDKSSYKSGSVGQSLH